MVAGQYLSKNPMDDPSYWRESHCIVGKRFLVAIISSMRVNVFQNALTG